MMRSSLFIAAVWGGMTAAAPTFAAELHALLFPLTDEIRLANKGPTPVPFVFYSITSDSGALDGSSEVWISISGNYDANGNGFIDPVGAWQTLSSTSTELTEGVPSGPGGSLPAMRAISLGSIWNPFATPFPDLVFDIRNDQQSVAVTIELALDGDYSGDGVVDAADYVLWRKYLGSTTVLTADGDLNGLVDAGDHSVWRANYGQTLPLPPFGLGGASALAVLSSGASLVPEPTTGALALVALGCWMCVIARAPARRAGPLAARRRAARR